MDPVCNLNRSFSIPQMHKQFMRPHFETATFSLLTKLFLMYLYQKDRSKCIHRAHDILRQPEATCAQNAEALLL